MKIKHIWSILCKESIINQDDNIISLIGVLEEIKSTIFPTNSHQPLPDKLTIPFNFEVVNYWVKDSSKEAKMQIRIAIIDPSGKELSNNTNESIFPQNITKLRTRLKVQGLSVNKSGEYQIIVSLKAESDKSYKLVAELPLSIKINIEEQRPSSN